MLRLKATKTSLYKLVESRLPSISWMRLPNMKYTRFVKAARRPDYFLEWGGLECQYSAFLSSCLGTCILKITLKRCGGADVTVQSHKIPLTELRERGMVEEYSPKRRSAGRESA